MTASQDSWAPHFGGIAWPRRADALTLHLSVGAELQFLKVDRHDFALVEISRLTLPAPVQYVVAHPTRSLLYVAASNRWIPDADDLHVLTTVAIDERTGAMTVVGEAVLSTRPIHLTVTPTGDGLLVAYNAPAGVTWHAVGADGIAQPATPQDPPVATGRYPHQVRVLPSGDAAVLVVRGNHASAACAEEPGSLQFLSMHDGVLATIGTVAPGAGIGFGPRHLDFHPGGRWAALSMERSNELQVFAVNLTDFAPLPAFVTTTLPASRMTSAADHDQLSSAIHFHPRGHVLYVANRHDPSVYGAHGQPGDHAGNNLAVYAFDAASGRAELLQHVATESVHVRTFSLDQSGRLLLAVSLLPALMRRDGVLERVPARLSFFRVADDGTLALAHVRDMPDETGSMFWSSLDGRC